MRFVPFFLAACFVSVLVVSSPVYPGTVGSGRFFGGLTAGWHSREGYMDFGDDRLQYVERSLMPSIGVMAGRYFGLPLGMRLALPFMFEYGAADEETIDVDIINYAEPQSVVLTSVMYHVGVQPLLQVPFRCRGNVFAYGAAGAGVHYVALVEEERFADDRSIRVEDDFLEESRRVSLSAAAAVGLEYHIRPYFGIAVQYMFRFWKPVHNFIGRDLYILEKQRYVERFCSHGVSVLVLLSNHR